MKKYEKKPLEFCTCKDGDMSITIDWEFGYWDACSKCGKPIAESFHPYDHYDGEDHIDIDEER